jgi:hypothetical protein
MVFHMHMSLLTTCSHLNAPLTCRPPEEMNDPDHFVPAWTYNPEDGRGRKGPISREQAMAELAEVVGSIKPDKFEPKIVKQTADYLYAEFQSPTFGFIDDVEVRGGQAVASLMQQRLQH